MKNFANLCCSCALLLTEQLSDYDSSYAQQRVDVNSYNTKQEKQQQLLLANQQSQQQYDGYDQDYYASAGKLLYILYINCL